MTSRHTEASRSNIADLLPVPDWSDLSEQQGRGKACVWCGIILSTATAVDLGVRRIRVLDGHLNTYPRGCRTCMAAKVEQAAEAHASHCELCVDNLSVCATARALRRLVLEHGR